MTLQSVEVLLDHNLFIRIHRSFIVSIHEIKSFNASEIEIGKTKIPVGRNYRETVMQVLKK